MWRRFSNVSVLLYVRAFGASPVSLAMTHMRWLSVFHVSVEPQNRSRPWFGCFVVHGKFPRETPMPFVLSRIQLLRLKALIILTSIGATLWCPSKAFHIEFTLSSHTHQETVPAVTPWMMVWDSAHYGAETNVGDQGGVPCADAVLC